MPPQSIITHELARQLTELSREINRQLGLLITRKGEVAYVIVGDHRGIMIPDLTGYRFASTRFKGLRLIHSHLNDEGLSDEDLTDLALLRLDLICAVEARPDGLPGLSHVAHLIPENPEGRYWLTLPPALPSELDQNFTAFIRALEGEFAQKQKTRKIDTTDRAILVRVETVIRGTRSGPFGGHDPDFLQKSGHVPREIRSCPPNNGESSLDELKELARSSGVEVFDRIIQRRPEPDPKFLLGKGRLSQLVIKAMQIGANLLIFDHELTPAQARSIADFTEMKVIDRTQLILDIFAMRAHSREGKIQVELAQLKYLLPRLTTKDKAMSRLTGGIGARGPGETKLEINRRRVRERIHHLEKEVHLIERARGQRRVKREKTAIPVISIVGYTNAGKSTLLNTLTNSQVFTEDRLFATLDPKSSRLRFPRDAEAVITDTVGFIRDLPPDLFAAFRATLDELKEADVLLHLVDVSNPDFENHIQAVEKILQELDIAGKPTALVFNKEDRIADKSLLTDLCRRFGAIAVSALNPASLPPLVERLAEMIQGRAGQFRKNPPSPPLSKGGLIFSPPLQKGGRL
ncbi:MAG: GTPase HflX [Syntrophales bacterium]|nr:GTPase HflX [Syntrophales bacterium]